MLFLKLSAKVTNLYKLSTEALALKPCTSIYNTRSGESKLFIENNNACFCRTGLSKLIKRNVSDKGIKESLFYRVEPTVAHACQRGVPASMGKILLKRLAGAHSPTSLVSKRSILLRQKMNN